MPKQLIDDRDQMFVLFEQLEIQKLSEAELYSDFDEDTYVMILNEAEKLAVNVIMPAYAEADKIGCVFKDGNIEIPQVFHEPWRLWNEGEWRRIDLPREIGGQGLPLTIGMAANEFFEAANLAFQTLTAMPRGVALLIGSHGTEEQKIKYVEKILSGQWTGTMALTEPGAGSDVGATKTVAVPNDDGTYNITGGKIFITNGDNNLTENVIHLALARIKGSPPGTKGLSLFIIPKYRVNSDGSTGDANDTKLISVENKMGLKGSPTCQIAFGEENECVGELIGEIDRGIPVFFTMMNESRLIVARHGASIASRAYLSALNYSKERLQGREAGAPPDSPQVPIIKHPDIRRMLMMMKSYTEGIRALILYTTYCMDMELISTNEEEKLKWSNLKSFLTPVAKAYGTDMSFKVTETAMQVYGGYGYMKDYPVEQFLRDEKVNSLYEGTNGIQALDLAGRKVLRDSKGLIEGLLEDIKKFCKEHENHISLNGYIKTLSEARDSLMDVTLHFVDKAGEDFETIALHAVQYTELFGDITVGWLLLWQAVIAEEKIAAIKNKRDIKSPEELNTLIKENSEAAFYSGKLVSARYFTSNVLSQSAAKANCIIKGDKAALDIAEEAF